MKKILIFLCFFFLLIPMNILANEQVNVYIFHNYNCPHCAKAIEYFQELEQENKQIKLYTYELLRDENAYNRVLYNEVCNILNIEISNVPLIVIGNDYYIGFNDARKEKMQKTLNFYLENEYKDVVGITLKVVDENNKPIIKEEQDNEYIIDTIFGQINLKNFSLPIITIIIGLVDGFNPCAMWILLFLITMLFNMANKRKMWILGLTFILTSGFIYFLFMMAWLNVGKLINSIHLLQIIVGIFAIIFGLINIYHYIKERKEDGCVVIKKEKRKFIFTNIKKIVENKYFALAIIGIILLASMVNLIELMCSLGLPIMFTEILSINNLSSSEYLRYIFLYIFFFILDDLVVFIISMITLKSTAISAKYNKYSHLIGGIIMFLIGLLMIFKPEWLSFNF